MENKVKVQFQVVREMRRMRRRKLRESSGRVYKYQTKTKWFEQTINPFNKGGDPHEIATSVKAEADAWVAEMEKQGWWRV